MLIKRVFNGGKLDHLIVKRTSKQQNFSQKIINEFLADGVLTMGNGQLVLAASPANLTYNIIRTPGYYCCFDDKKLADEAACKQYIAENFKGKTSPDANNPVGYRKDNFYACELVGDD